MDNVFDAGKEHLRKQAEALLADTSRPVEDLPPEKVRELIHDYQVHQIELELQNEELRSAQRALEESRERYFDLYDLAPVGYVTLSEHGLILEANLTAATLLGMTRGALTNQPISLFILKEDQNINYLHRKKLFASGEPQEWDLRLVKPDGALFWAHLQGTVAQADDGAPLCRVVLSDIADRKRAEKALRASEEKFRSIFASMTEIVVLHELVCDEDDRPTNYRILDCNPAFTRITGIRSEDAVGRLATDVYGADNAPYFDKYARVALTGEPCNFITAYAPINKHFDIHVASPGKNMFVTITTDITASKQAEEERRLERERLAGIIKGTNAGTWEWNVQSGETVFNERWAEIIGYTLEEISPVSIETWMKFAHPDDLNISEELLEKHFKGQSDYYEFESRMRHKNGQWVWVQDRGRVLTWTEDGNPLMMFGTHLDITARKAAEREIKDINEQLLKSCAEKDKLFSIIGHDLRSPMTGLVASTEMLANEPELFSEKDIRTLSTELHKTAKNTFALLEDLLQWARISQGGIDFAPESCGLDELVDMVLSTAQDMAKAKDIAIRQALAQGLTVRVDQPMVKTVIRNILFNAVKFTHRGGEIVIRARQEGQTVTVAVQDNGMGMNEQVVAAIFTLNKVKCSLGTEGEKGTGLGLILCKQFIEQHGGEIWAESELGKGTTVFFTLPANV